MLTLSKMTAKTVVAEYRTPPSLRRQTTSSRVRSRFDDVVEGLRSLPLEGARNKGFFEGPMRVSKYIRQCWGTQGSNVFAGVLASEVAVERMTCCRSLIVADTVASGMHQS